MSMSSRIGATPTSPNPPPGEVVLATTLTVRHGDDSVPDGDHRWFYTLRCEPNDASRLSQAAPARELAISLSGAR
jgi:hypothetical protein